MMILWMTHSSPFARKVRVVAAELGQTEKIALREVDPWRDETLRALNPLAKVPTLALQNGTVLFESGVICDYLDSLATGRRLIPAEGPERLETLLWQGLADGAMTAVGRLFSDEQKPPHLQPVAMMDRFRRARDGALDMFERQRLRDSPLLGEIATGCLLAYLDFRWPARDWRGGRPNLARWFASFEQRDAMRRTAHPSDTAPTARLG